MTPLEYYQQQIISGAIHKDANQLKVIKHLESIYHALIQRQQYRDSQIGKLRRKIKPREPIQGLYLWGSVGIGKTYLIDSFYQCVPVKKMRMHFHPFMQRIHNELSKIQGQKDPLQIIAKKIANDYLVICFDEFFVSNITDAMLLGELFKALFKGGVCLIATSNEAPDELYKNGLQRQRFLPAIALIKQFTQVMHLSSDTDYRLRHIQQAGVYYTPLNEIANDNMEHSFKHFSQNTPTSKEAIQLFGRPIRIVKQAGNTIWFDFKDICGRPRSQKDYLAIAKQYKTVLISNVPLISPHQRDLIVSFINLIDIFYDAHTRLVISAAAVVENLYIGEYMQFEFQRTKSRLIEMQSADYFD